MGEEAVLKRLDDWSLEDDDTPEINGKTANLLEDLSRDAPTLICNSLRFPVTYKMR